LPLSIAPGDKKTISLVYKPTAVEKDAATLTITSDDIATPTLTVQLTGEGSSTAIAATPLTLEFGQVAIGTTSDPQQVTITNTSGSPIVLKDAALSGAGSAAFKTTSIAGTLSGGQTRTMTVMFAPTTTDDLTVQAVIATVDSSVATIQLSMHGVGIQGAGGGNGNGDTSTGAKSGCACGVAASGGAGLWIVIAVAPVALVLARRRARRR
jgi:hypothetical protein